MKRERAEGYYNEVLICPLCEYTTSERRVMITHLEDSHTDEEAIEQLG
jgi:hypothetical protein